MYCTIAVNERCGILGGVVVVVVVVVVGLCCCRRGEGGRVAVCRFFVLLVCVVSENPGTSCPICWYYVSEVLTLCLIH